MTCATSFLDLIRLSRTRPWSTRAHFLHAMSQFWKYLRYLMTSPEAKAIFKEIGYLKCIWITIFRRSPSSSGNLGGLEDAEGNGLGRRRRHSKKSHPV